MTNPFDQFDTPAANANPFDQFDAPGAKKPVEGGLLASVKQTVGSTIKGAGQLASDVGVADKDNALTRTGQGIIDANPTAVHSLGDIVDSPWTATKEAVGNAGASVGGVLGARALGMGITAAAPLAGPAAPVVALAGQALSWLGPAAIAALPSYGGIRDKQILNDPANQEDGYAKAKAALGAAAVGAIEARFGPQNWAAAMLTKEGRAKAAEMFASTTMKGAVGKGLLQGALVEGAEELVQNPVEQLAAGDDPLTAESLKDTAFSGAMGAIGGGVAGGGVRGAQHLVAPSPKNPITDANTFEEAHAAFQFDVDSNRPVLDLAEMAKSYKDHTPEELVAQQRELLRAVSGNPEYVIGEDGTHTFNGAPLKVVAAQELPLEGEGLTRHAYEAISALNEAQGKRTVVYANDERLPDGMAQQPDVAFVSSHTTFDPAVVVAHEVQHLSEEGDKQAEFARIVKEELTTQAQDLAIQRHGKLADDRLHQEIRGDIAGDALADPTFHTRVITKMQEQLGEKEAESHAQAFLASIKGLIDRIKAILTGKTFTTPDGERLASQYVKDLQRVHDALAAAMAAQFIKQGYETGAKVRADAKLARTAVGRTIAEAAKALPQTEVAHAQDVMTEILANPGEIFKKARERIAIDTRPEVGKAIAAMDADPNAIFEIARTQPAILKTIAAVASERVNAQPKAEPVKEEPAKPAPDTRPDVAAGVKSMTPDHVNLVALALKRGTGLEETIAKAQTDLGKLEAEKKKVEAARAKTKSDEKVKVESKRAKEKVAPKDEGATSEVKLSPKSDKIEAARATNQGTYLNVGLSTAELRGPGTFLHQSEVERAIKALGVGVIRTTTTASKTEPTAVVRIDRPLTIAQLDALSVTLHQEAIPQLHNGSGIMGGPKASAWGPFNPDFFYMPNGKTMSKNASPFAKNSALARAVPATLDDVSSMAAAVALARGQKFATGRDFKLALQARVQAAAEAAKVDLTEDTPEVRNYIRRSMLREVQDGIRTNANAIGWYDEKVTKALRVLSLLHPEIVTDPESKFAFIWALAVTSNGMKVNKNFVLAERAYASWKRSGGTKGGKFDEVGEGPTKKKINDGLNSYRTMMDKYGYAALSKTMLSQASVREIQKATGIKPSGEGMNEILFGASILGPKIGNGFFMNLNGEFGQLTMDRWWQRMWGRLTGTLVIEDKQKVLKSKDQFLSLVRLISSDPETKKVVEQTLAAKLVTGDAIGTAEAIQRATMGEEVRLILQDAMPASDDAVYTQLVSIQGQPAKGKEFLSVGDELRKAALRYLKNIDGQKEAPTAEDRRMMRSIAQQVLVEVQKTNPDITMADMQAILWYPEKRVYDAAGLDETGEEGYEDSEAPDYANAAVRLARDNGISQERINQAVSEADNDIQARKRAGRSGREPGRLSAAGEAGEGTAGEVSAAGSEAGARTESGEVDGQTRSDARGRGPARASPKSRLLPAHGAARPDGVDVFGTHYSRAERSSLASSAYGTGYRGAEYARVQAAIDDRLRHRVYFYVDTGKGINPEGGVGSVPHGAKLNGLYDIGHDPLDLYARAHEAARESGTDVMNAFESALLDAGFDGYFTREYAKQGAAVLLGNRAVQVAKLDEPIGEVAPAMAPFTGPKLRAREIMADRSLPAGQMSGERWMKLVPDAKLDADRLYYKDGVARAVLAAGEVKYSPKVDDTFTARRDAQLLEEEDRDTREMIQSMADSRRARTFEEVLNTVIPWIKSVAPLVTKAKALEAAGAFGFGTQDAGWALGHADSIWRDLQRATGESIPMEGNGVAGPAGRALIAHNLVANVEHNGKEIEETLRKHLAEAAEYRSGLNMRSSRDRESAKRIDSALDNVTPVKFSPKAETPAERNARWAREEVEGQEKVEAFQAAYDANPVPGVSVAFEKYTSDEVELANIEAKQKGRGRGSAAMSRIVELADATGTNLMLLPAGEGRRRERLVEFYERFGFNEEDNGVMRRSAIGGVKFSPKSPAFKKWFGDSKVVDERGEPLVVYHGTDRTFDKFDIKAKRAHIMFTEKDPQGFYFTKNAGWAYAGGGDGDRVIPAYLRITSPLRTERGSHEHVIVPKARMLELKAKGYDGIIYDEGDEIVVFSPDQIKSVFNPDAEGGAKFSPKIVGASSRTYTPEQKRMFEKVGRTVDVPSVPQRVAALRKDMGKKLAQGIVDQFAPLKELSPMAYMLARLSKGSAGAFEAMLHHGKLRLNAGAYDADRSGGFIEKVGIPLQGEMEDFLWYVAANRAERLSAQDRERLFSASDIAAGKSLANGNLTFDYTLANGTVTRSRRQAYEDSVKKFDAFNKNALDMAEQSGLIDPASRKIWEHEFYVPFYRVSEEDGNFVGAKIGNGLVRQRAFKALKGGTDKLNSDLLANTLANWAHLIDAGAKNRAAKSALEAAASMGVAVEADAATVKAMGQAIGKKNATVWFVEGGVQRHFLVDDPFVLTAITSLEYSGMKGPLMDAMSAFKHWLTVGVTASPVFKVKNLIRDSVQAVATSPLSANIPGNIRQGIAASDHSTQNYVSALASGGLIRFGTMLEGRTADRVRQLVKSGIKDTTILNSNAKVQAMYDKYLEPAIAAYNELGNRSEEITRSALFEQLKAKGMDHATAALMARDLMDFSLQGSWTGIRFLTQVVPFMNARLQGMYKLGRAATEDPKRMAAVIGATTLFSLSLLAAYGGDDDWKKREDWDRDNFWWFKLGGVAFRIPKPFEIGAVATLAERGFEYFTDKEMTGKRFTDRTLKLLGDNLSMNPVPQMVKPILDVYANKNGFTGRPIETLGMENLAPDYRYTSRTSMLARGASTAGQSVTSLVGGNFLSPVQIDSMLQGYFSWLGSFVVGASEIVARPATGQAERPAGDPWKFATGGLITELPADQSRYVSHMYEQSKIVEQAMGTYRDLVKQGRRAEAAEFLAEHREDVTKYKATEAVKKAESKLNERVRMIERSAKSPEEKKALISAIREQQDRIARIVKYQMLDDPEQSAYPGGSPVRG